MGAVKPSTRSHPMSSPSIRPGFSSVSPYLVFRDAAKALDFYRHAFGALEVSRHADADGAVRHGEFKIGDSTFMVTTESAQYPFMRSAEALGNSPVQFFLYVENVDTLFQRVLDLGAQVVMPVADQPYGRSGGLRDPFGLVWWLSTHKA